MATNIGRVKAALERMMRGGVTRREAEQLDQLVRQGGVERDERKAVRRALVDHERDVFEAPRARRPLLAVAGAPGKPLFGLPEVNARMKRALSDGKLAAPEAWSMIEKLRGSTTTASARARIEAVLRDDSRVTPAARRAFARALGIGRADPVDLPADKLFDAEELAFMNKLNAYRAELGLKPVTASTVLTRSSQGHSEDMASRETLSHTGSDGSDLLDRVMRESDRRRALGEIVAMNTVTGEDAFAAWKASPGHDAIMRDPEFIQVGIARVQSPQGRWFWTANFGGA